MDKRLERLREIVHEQEEIIKAWFTAAIDGEWDEELDGDIIERLWRSEH